LILHRIIQIKIRRPTRDVRSLKTRTPVKGFSHIFLRDVVGHQNDQHFPLNTLQTAEEVLSEVFMTGSRVLSKVPVR